MKKAKSSEKPVVAEPSDQARRSRNSSFAAFRHREFSLFVFGKLSSVVSYHMIMIALAYQIYDQTGDTLHLALINLVMIGPTVGLGLFIGYIVDSFDRRNVLIVCFVSLMATAALLLSFTIFQMERLWPIYAVLFLIGTVRAFYGPSSNALVPGLVEREVFPNAIAWNASITKIAQVCGPMIGGFLYLLGPEAVYGTATGIFLLSALSALIIRPRGAPERQAGGVSMRSLLAGLVFVFEKKMILGAVVIDLFIALMGGVNAMLPVFAKDILNVGPAGAGILRSAISIGGLTAGLVLTQVTFHRAGMAMLIGVGIFGASMACFAFSTSFPLSVLALAICGAADMMNVNVRQTLLQIATPDALRGRVSAVNSISANLGNELGGFRAATFAAFMGAVPAVAVGGVAVIVLAAVCPKVFPELARVKRLDRAL